MEVLLNYASQYNSQRDNDDDNDNNDAGAILVETPWAGKPFDEVRTCACWALFEITAAVVDGRLNVYANFSQRMTRQSSICPWISAFQEALASVADILPVMEPPHIDGSSLGRNNGHA
jgi:hypothetical protein